MRVLIIIPAYNEQACLAGTVANLEPLRRHPGTTYDIVIVNDGSTDRTAEVCRSLAVAHAHVHWLNLPFNCGIGGAMQAGFRFAVQENYDYALQFDADGQHDAEYIPKLFAFAQAQQLDLAVGSRFLDPNGPNFRSTWLRRVGITFFTRLISSLTRVRVTDPTSGFRVLSRQALQCFARSYPDDYPEPEAIFWCVRNGLKVGELPVVMHARQGGVSSIRYLRTGYYMVKVTAAILIDRLRTREWIEDER